MSSEITIPAIRWEQQSESSMLALIDRAARDPSVDVAKMEQLLALAERVHDRDARSQYDQAMNAAQSEMRPISRDCHNPQTRSRYASYEAIDNAIRPVYTNHGFALSFGSKAGGPDRVIVTCRISHRAGHVEHQEVEMPADGKGAKGGDVMTKTHAVGSALSYGKRYLVNLIFNLSFGEADDDGNAAGRVQSHRTTQRPVQTVKTPENSQPAPKQATVADVLPKKATPMRRTRVLDFLRKSFEESELEAFAHDRKFIFGGQRLEEWNLENIPVLNTALNDLVAEIGRWLDPEAPSGEAEEYPDFMNTKIHIPPKGQTMADYRGNEDTIASLYCAAQAGIEAAASRLFGYVSRYEPKPYNGKPPSQEDFDLRVALDQFKAWHDERSANQAERLHQDQPDLIP